MKMFLHGGDLSREGAISSTHHIQSAALTAFAVSRRRGLDQQLVPITRIGRLGTSTRHLNDRIRMQGDPRIAIGIPVEIIPEACSAWGNDARVSGLGTVRVDGDAAVGTFERVGEVQVWCVGANAVDADGSPGRFGRVGRKGRVLKGHAVVSRRGVDLPHGTEDGVGDEDGARVSSQCRCAVEALCFFDVGDELHGRWGWIHVDRPQGKGSRMRQIGGGKVARDHGEDVFACFSDTEDAGDVGNAGQVCGRYGRRAGVYVREVGLVRCREKEMAIWTRGDILEDEVAEIIDWLEARGRSWGVGRARKNAEGGQE